MPVDEATAAGLTLDFHIVQGQKLMVSDINWRGTRSSDPFGRIFVNGKQRGYTKTVFKSESPLWDEHVIVVIGADEVAEFLTAAEPPVLQVQIWDKDRLSFNDPMGTITIDWAAVVDGTTNEPAWYDVEQGEGGAFAEDAAGQVELAVTAVVHRYRLVEPGLTYPLSEEHTKNLQIGITWNDKNQDVDLACVAVRTDGTIHLVDCAYYAQPSNDNSSLRHQGDRQGAEAVKCQLHRVPAKIMALYLVASTPADNHHLGGSGLTAHVADAGSGIGLLRLTPGDEVLSANPPSLILSRLLRDPNNDAWYVTPVTAGDKAAHDFGALLPRLQAYTRDVLPDLPVDPYGRRAILRKSGTTVRLLDYVREMPTSLTFALNWTAKEKKDDEEDAPVDLNAAALCFDESNALIETVSVDNVASESGAIRHGGETTDEGDDEDTVAQEKLSIILDRVPAAVQTVVFIVNSASGEALSRVENASCRLVTDSGKALAVYSMDGARDLFGKTALLVCALYRSSSGDGEWMLRIISQGCRGKMAAENVDEARTFLEENPPSLPFVLPAITEQMIDASVLPEQTTFEGDDEELVVSLGDFLSSE